MRKIKLVIISTHPIQYNAPLFELLESRGMLDVQVLYTWGEEVLQEKYDPDFQKVIQWDIDLLKGYNYRFLKNVAQEKGSHHFNGIDNPDIVQQIEQIAPDCILVYGWPLKSHLKVMRYFHKKIPVLFRGDSTLLDQKKNIKTLIRKIFLTWVYRHIDYALYAGKSNRDYFLYAGLKAAQLSFMPHAIDNRRFGRGNADYIAKAKAWRNKLGVSENGLLLLFAGKFEAKKNPVGLLHAFLQLNAPNAFLLFVGNGVLETELKTKAKENGNVLFMDFVNQADMPAVYEMADAFVLPSQGPGESWGLSVNEAMANAKPVVVSNKCGCAADLVHHGENGYLFDVSVPNALFDTLLLLMNNRARFNELGEASLQIIQQYQFSEQAKQIEELCATIKSSQHNHKID